MRKRRHITIDLEADRRKAVEREEQKKAAAALNTENQTLDAPAPIVEATPSTWATYSNPRLGMPWNNGVPMPFEQAEAAEIPLRMPCSCRDFMYLFDLRRQAHRSIAEYRCDGCGRSRRITCDV